MDARPKLSSTRAWLAIALTVVCFWAAVALLLWLAVTARVTDMGRSLQTDIQGQTP